MLEDVLHFSACVSWAMKLALRGSDHIGVVVMIVSYVNSFQLLKLAVLLQFLDFIQNTLASTIDQKGVAGSRKD